MPEAASSATSKIIYFDPTVSYENREPLHNIPESISQSLLQKFFDTEIISISSAIQSYRLEDDEIVIDNNHCGPFVCYFMPLLANGNARLNPDGSNKIQVKNSNDQWQNIDILSSEQSDEAGNKIRELQDNIIAEPGVAVNQKINFDFSEERPSSVVDMKGLVQRFERLAKENNNDRAL